MKGQLKYTVDKKSKTLSLTFNLKDPIQASLAHILIKNIKTVSRLDGEKAAISMDFGLSDTVLDMLKNKAKTKISKI